LWGRQYLDTPEIYNKRLEVDWANAVAKKRFRDVVARADDEGFAGVRTELQECKEAYRKHFPLLVRVFNHYCCTFTEGEDSVYQLRSNAWALMVKELKLASPESKHCQATNCQNAFVGTSHIHREKVQSS
jgi:hypothetical protein